MVPITIIAYDNSINLLQNVVIELFLIMIVDEDITIIREKKVYSML